jgi:2-isopropylmalate synthase
MDKQKIRSVEVYDTSLRDGLQQPNLDISIPNAVMFLEHMGAFGVHYAEIGFAGANQFAEDLTQALRNVDTGAMKLALFGRTRGRGTKVEEWPDVQSILRHKDRVGAACIVVKSRLLDIERSLETTPEENLLMTLDTVAYLQDHGLEVLIDLEHAMDAVCGRRENGKLWEAGEAKKSLDYFHELTEQCVKQGVSRIVVCDTNGGASPEEVAELFADLTRRHPAAKFGFHGHTDRGLGEANTRAAILNGAAQVQGTMVGTGERCGNVNLTTVIGGLQLRGEASFVSDKALAGLTSLAHTTYGAFGVEIPHGAPIVGPGAFGTWAGMHGSSERKNPGAYLWCDPALVGATPTIGVNAQSGRANIIMLSEALGVALTSAEAQELMDANLSMIEGGGYTASEVSFRLAAMRVRKSLPHWFGVRSWRVADELDETGGHFAHASMTMTVGDSTVAIGRAEGAGPVDAMTRAMRHELEKHYPALAEMRLGTFTVTALDVKAHDSAAHVRVTVSFLADGHEPWTTAGVSSDLNQAALMAIVDGFQDWLRRKGECAA